MTRRAPVLLLAALLAAAPAAAGCDAFAWLLVKTVGPLVPEDEAKAEYELKGKSLLILVDVNDPMLASEFPRLEPELTDAVAAVLSGKGACGPIVPAHSVAAARRSERDFPKWSVAQAGKYFNVDFVMHIELFEFRLKDDPRSNVYRGYAEAAVRLVDPETGEQVWPMLAAARLVKGETLPAADSEEAARQEHTLTEGFAAKIARHFYTYKLSDLPFRPEVK